MKDNKKNSKLIVSLTKKLKEIIIDFIGDEEYAVGGVLENRFLFDRFVKIIKNNPEIDKPNSFLNYIRINYVTTAIVAICRQVDTNSDSVSLLNLLFEIHDNAEKITKKWFTSNYKADEQRGEKEFEKFFGKLKHIDPGIVYADIGKLIFYTKKIKKFRHKRVAHLDKKKKIRFDIDFNILDNAIDLIEEILMKYYILLGQFEKDCPIPEIAPNTLSFRDDKSDEEDIFCVPWKNCKK